MQNVIIDIQLGESAAGQPGNAGQAADPWGGMGPIISTSTIPDPWGGIGGVGVPPSRGSPLVFGSSSPPSTGAKPAPADPWGSSPAASAAAPVNVSNGNNDPWGATSNTETSPAKRKCSTHSSHATQNRQTECVKILTVCLKKFEIYLNLICVADISCALSKQISDSLKALMK